MTRTLGTGSEGQTRRGKAPGSGKMEACGTSPIGRVDQTNSQTIMAMRTASKYIILVPTMDGMTILAFVAVRSSAAGEFVQVVCALVVL